jgi:oxalate decarboxylase/phosphoglucose isomerase-like protein (cupin superfamily)
MENETLKKEIKENGEDMKIVIKQITEILVTDEKVRKPGKAQERHLHTKAGIMNFQDLNSDR